MTSSAANNFKSCLVECIDGLKAAKRKHVDLGSYSSRADDIRTKLAALKKAFVKLNEIYTQDQSPRVAFQIAGIEPLLNHVFTSYPGDPRQMIELLTQIKFIAESSLAAEIETAELKRNSLTDFPFLPDELVEDRHKVLKKVLREVNQCYMNCCYNACAAMIRRLVETLIVDAYEHHGLRNLIVDSKGDYLKFGDLIGKTSAQPEFRLTRETKRILADLKFYGDLGAHNRMALVRKPDLDRLHNATRIAIEELYKNT